MADNILVKPATGSNVSIASDDVGGVLYQRVKPAFGVDGSATDVSTSNPLPVAPAAGESHLGSVSGHSIIVGDTFTRPADTTAYAVGDLVANNVTAGSVTPLTLQVARANDTYVTIPRLRLKKSGTSLTNAQFRVHLYKALPTLTNGDNGAWLTTESTYIGSVDITMDKAFSDGAKGFGVPSVGSAFIADPSTGTRNIYALIEARAAYTPASAESFTLTAEVLRD